MDGHANVSVKTEADLVVKGGAGAAGIGLGNAGQMVGDVRIAAGTGSITATGGHNVSGIGLGNSAELAGGILISAASGVTSPGHINATGGYYGAGIGCGYNSSKRIKTHIAIAADCGAIVAKGGTGGAGIGGSCSSNVGDITIAGGDITASSDKHGAGIGGGWVADNGNITISGGKINAFSPMHGTGIGAGCQGTSGDIVITGGEITAQGGDDGAGIGASWRGQCGSITLTGAGTKIIASGGHNGSGIGAGGTSSQDTPSRAGDILIADAEIYASGGNSGAGIGAGNGGENGKITITSGKVSAKGGTHAAGIGSGTNATSGDIIITGGSVSALGGWRDTAGNANKGGHIVNFTDHRHEHAGTITLGPGGNNQGSLTIKAGPDGEGLYATSATDASGQRIYGYPVNQTILTNHGLPAGVTITGLASKGETSGQVLSWDGSPQQVWKDGAFANDNSNLKYIWMTGEDQTLTVTYETADGSTATKDFNLKFYPYAGVFRFPSDPAPQLPDLVVDITPTPLPDPDPDPNPDPDPGPNPDRFAAFAIGRATWQKGRTSVMSGLFAMYGIA